MPNPFRLPPQSAGGVIRAMGDSFSKAIRAAMGTSEPQTYLPTVSEWQRERNIKRACEVVFLPKPGKSLQYYDPNYTMWLEHECNLCPEKCAFCGDIRIDEFNPTAFQEWRQYWHEEWRLLVGVSAPIVVTGSGLATYFIAR